MVKVKALIDFNDYEAGIFRTAGKEFECTEERAKVLAGDNDSKRVYAEIIGEPYLKIGKSKLSTVIENGEQIKKQNETIEEKPKRKKRKLTE